MNYFQLLPTSALSRIVSLSENDLQSLALVSKGINAVIRSYVSAHFKDYSENTTLEPFAKLARRAVGSAESEDLNFQKVKFVVQKITKKAEYLGISYLEIPILKPSLQNISATQLQSFVDSMEREKEEGENFMPFASEIFSQTPDLQNVLKKHAQKKLLNKVRLIKVWMKSNPEKLENIKNLDLTKLKLIELPKEIQYLKNLNSLDLSKNELSTLPNEIGSLSKLERLVLDKNQFTVIPIEIKSLAKLKHLSFCNNQLAVIPNWISSLINLISLHVADNLISTLPEEIESLSGLVALNLAGNQFDSIPSKVRALSQLKSLEIQDNRLEIIPDFIRSLSKLERLDLAGNLIKSLPAQIGRLKMGSGGTYMSLQFAEHIFLEGRTRGYFPSKV